MVKKITVKGIAFVVLLMSIISTGLAITITNPASNQTVSSTSGSPQSFTIDIDHAANVTWTINDSILSSGIVGNVNTITSTYTNSSGAAGTWEIKAVAENTSNITDTATRIWTWTVTAAALPPPSITGFNPPLSFTSYVGTPVEFNLTVDQIANVTWKIDGGQVQFNESVPVSTQAKYTNSTASVTIYTVEANASNANGSAVKTWTWNVTTPPGPNPVSGLTVAEKGATWINWTWAPPGGNFNYTMVTINGSFQTNTTDNFYNYSSFGVGTSNTISLQTVDTFGAVSSTASNQSTTMNTPVGTNIIVSISGTNVTFSQVNGDANTSVSISSTNSWGPLSFTPVGNYYDVSLTPAA